MQNSLFLQIINSDQFREANFQLIIQPMAELYEILKPENKYYDRKNYASQQQYNTALKSSSTVYVGNLSFYTTQDSIKELFSLAGNITQIKMGIDDDGNPCGFAFVIYQTREEALLSVQFISRTKLNNRIIRVDLDPGFKQGRQKGRGANGQQRRDQFRNKDDADRPKKFTDNKIEKKEFNKNRQYNNARGNREHHHDKKQFYNERKEFNFDKRQQRQNDYRRQSQGDRRQRQYDPRRQNYQKNSRNRQHREDNQRNLNRGDSGKLRQNKQDVDY